MELEISKLTKEYHGFRAVDEVSLTMQKGVYGLLGVNGAGKTTLMRMICTLVRPTSGAIFCDGQDIFEMDGAYRKLLGYLPQEFGFYPDFTVEDYLRYIASIKGLRPSVSRHRIDELIYRVGMVRYGQKKMKKLSGGMKRRVGIAQAMLNDPKILILDEPTAGLDPGERIRFRNLISELSEERLVLLSTHIVSDIESVANMILFMKDGKIQLSGTAQELVASAPVQVWRVVVPLREADDIQSRCLVSNRRTVQGGAELRIVAERQPFAESEKETLSLEDLFLYLYGEKAGDDNGEI